MANKQVWTATGRRKSSVAQVKLVGGTGKITVMVKMFMNICLMKH